jgi:hypothetical protein
MIKRDDRIIPPLRVVKTLSTDYITTSVALAVQMLAISSQRAFCSVSARVPRTVQREGHFARGALHTRLSRRNKPLDVAGDHIHAAQMSPQSGRSAWTVSICGVYEPRADSRLGPKSSWREKSATRAKPSPSTLAANQVTDRWVYRRSPRRLSSMAANRSFAPG